MCCEFLSQEIGDRIENVGDRFISGLVTHGFSDLKGRFCQPGARSEGPQPRVQHIKNARGVRVIFLENDPHSTREMHFDRNPGHRRFASRPGLTESARQAGKQKSVLVRISTGLIVLSDNRCVLSQEWGGKYFWLRRSQGMEPRVSETGEVGRSAARGKQKAMIFGTAPERVRGKIPRTLSGAVQEFKGDLLPRVTLASLAHPWLHSSAPSGAQRPLESQTHDSDHNVRSRSAPSGAQRHSNHKRMIQTTMSD